jgi:putative nucleotidyltransferase with HDIG domain
MIKKVKVEDLQPGMYVQDFNCSWIENPFFQSSLLLKDDGMISKIVDQGIRELYIDTDKGTDASAGIPAEEVKRKVHAELKKVVEIQPRAAMRVPAMEEFTEAKKVQKEAKKIVHDIMDDVRLGRQIKVEKVTPVVEKITDSIFRNKDALTCLGRIKQKHEYTFQHSVSVCALMVSFSRALGHNRDTINEIGVGALLHDVGKMKVPMEILEKEGSLSENEFGLMKSHVVHSSLILSETPGITQTAVDVAGQHHERVDGSGYPHALKTGEISLYGQMAAIVDVYDAITSDRCYHKGMEVADALRKLFEWGKFHFNNELVQTYIRTVGIYPVGSLVRMESGLLGVVVESNPGNLLVPVVRLVHDIKNDRRIKPYNADLSKPLGRGGADAIVCHESPHKWGINTLDYLDIDLSVLINR